MAIAGSKLELTLARISAPSPAFSAAAQRAFDNKTKPRRSLGRLEDLAVQVAAIRGRERPDPQTSAVVVVAGDHGIVEEGVSAYPQEVTAQMLANFAGGGAAICVLARAAGARLVVVDAGVKTDLSPAGVLDRRLGPGTSNVTKGPAMSREQALAGLEAGIELAELLADQGVGLIALGDMGIANTAISSAIVAALLQRDPEDVIGRGTGVDDDGLRRKVTAVRRAIALNAPDPTDPVGVLAAVGGFEHALLAGLALGGAAVGLPVVLDGFVVGAAAASILIVTALAGNRLQRPPRAARWCRYSSTVWPSGRLVYTCWA